MTKRQRNVLIVIAVSILIYFFVPPINNFVNDAVVSMMNLDLEGMVEYIRGYGEIAAVISFILMLLQSIISPIPAFFITLSNAAIFGWWQGAILSWTSSMVGAAMCFYIARGLGRDVVVRFTTNEALNSLEKFFDRYGKHTILVARLLPFMSFDLISYAAGLTSMTFWSFFIATGIGQLPATIVYSYLGQNISRGGQQLFTGLLILFALAIIIYVLGKVYNERFKKTAG